MSDRIDELVRRKRLIVCWDCFRDIPCTSCAPGQQFDEFATIAREAEAEADKWRKVAEEVAKMAADLSDEFVGAGAGPGEFIDEAVRRILIEQEEAE